MNIVDLVEEGRLYDALILTAGLIDKSEREEMDIGTLIDAYRLCHTKEADPYLLDMIKGGVLKILCNAMQKNMQVTDLMKLVEVISASGNHRTAASTFEEYLSTLLYQAADSMHRRGDAEIAYHCLSAIASLQVPVRSEYILLENELKENLQIQTTFSAFTSGARRIQNLEQPIIPTSARPYDYLGMKEGHLRVDILLEFSVAWCKVKSLYEAMTKDASFDCRIVAIDMQEPAWDSTTEYPAFLQFLNERDIPFVPEASYDLTERRPDVLIYTNPYDWHHPRFAIERVRQQGIRIVYLPYSIPFFVDVNNQASLYDRPIHRQAWRIYVRSQRERRKYGMYCQAGNAHVEITGAPVVDYLTEQRALIKSNCHFKKTFLWGVDYGFQNHTATFGEYGADLLKYFIEHPQLALIVRPHPLFYGMVTKLGVMSEAAVRSFYEQCEAAPNIFLDLDGDLTEAFCKSDALISDISSILVEYLAMGRPVLYLNTENTPNYKEYHEDDSDVLAHYYSGDSFDHIVQFIEMVVADKDPLREERAEILEKYFYRHQENAGEQIKEMLKDSLKNL